MKLKAPYLRSMKFESLPTLSQYPFNASLCRYWNEELLISDQITIFTGGNGSGKSTLLEAIAGAVGFDMAGGGVGYRPADHSGTIEVSGVELGKYLKISWRPRISTGWFFRAETFHTVARYLDDAAISAGQAPPDYLGASHGEGFMTFFEKRLRYRGIYLLDEPESAISPTRQKEFVDLLRRLAEAGQGQFFIATHSPIIMSAAGGVVHDIGHRGILKKSFRDTEAFRVYAEFLESDRSE